jgi:hypothetical protein
MRIKLLSISAVTYLCRSKKFGNSLFSTSLVFLSEKSSTPAEAANGLVGPELRGIFLKIITPSAVQRDLSENGYIRRAMVAGIID